MRGAAVTRISDDEYICRYSFAGNAFRCDDKFEVFVGSVANFEWRGGSRGSIPNRAVSLGGSRDHYVGRRSNNQPWDIGTVDRPNRAFFFASHQRNRWTERRERSYQVLCRRN